VPKPRDAGYYHELQEPAGAYNVNFEGKMGCLSVKKEYFQGEYVIESNG
jgi:hypothetical protein